MRADLLLLGELNYAGPMVAEVTGIPWASYVLAPLSFFSAFDPPVLPPYPKLARADKSPDGPRDQAGGPLHHAASGLSPSTTCAASSACPLAQPALRRQALP